jgi:hypothetical protein
MTLANGDQTGLADAATQAVAGKLNRERVWVDPGEAKPITISCWPQGTTSDIASPVQLIDAEEITVTGSRLNSIPPAAPPPPAPERDNMAQEERLGDVRLYRVPIEVTVAARSQKQIALLEQPSVKIETTLRLRPGQGPVDAPLERVLITRNVTGQGLGLPLPAGKVTLFATRGGRRILVGEGRIDDHTIGEKVEIPVATATGVRAHQEIFVGERGGGYQLTLTNDLATGQKVEIELPLEAKPLGARLIKRDGWMVWQVTVPANGRSVLRYRIGDQS